MKHLPAKLAVIGLAAGLAVAAPAGGDTIVSADRLGDSVLVREISLEGGAVRGVVVNNSGQRIEDLMLRVTCNWRWKNEFRPGSHGAGWSTTVPLAATLQPGASHPFEFAPPRPLPDRDDGYLVPEVSIAGYTAYAGSGAP
jgi:hypothetical protein